MAANQLTRTAARAATRALRSSGTARPRPHLAMFTRSSPRPILSLGLPRLVSTGSRRQRGIMPDSEDPQPPNPDTTSIPTTAANITESQYHQLADEYLDIVLGRFEKLQDENASVDVEYSAGVLNLQVPNIGTYVINKQPPNKQIWLSSPKSGPKRYDWVIVGDGQHQKEGTGEGDWIYLRDGTTLNELVLKEIGVDLREAE